MRWTFRREATVWGWAPRPALPARAGVLKDPRENLKVHRILRCTLSAGRLLARVPAEWHSPQGRLSRQVNHMMKLIGPLTCIALTTSCVIRDNPTPDPFGDIAFDWSFDGIATCDEAQVNEVDVEIFQDGELVLLRQGEPCEGGGLIFTDIREGEYEVFIDAFDRNGLVLYSGGFDIVVEGGVVNDAGLVVLDDVTGAPVPPALGSLAFFWVFPYPTDATLTFDCALAGVDEIDVTITPLGSSGAFFDDTFSCAAEGVEVANLPEGRYQVQVQAFGEYHEDAILLYDSGSFNVEVFGGELTDLEDVNVERANDAFSDFQVSWQLIEDTCVGAGIDTVTISYQRFGQQVPEDAFTVACDAASVLRSTFVPGSYDVSVAGIGSNDVSYLGTTTVDLPPGAVAEVNIVLAPTG